jgi:hypothetical protein
MKTSFFLAIVVALTACAEAADPGFGSALGAGTAVPAEWTVMVFLNGKNNLEEFAVKDLNEMEAAGAAAGVNVIAQLGRAKGYYTGDGDWTGVRRYLVRPDADMAHIASQVLGDLVGTDMGDYRSAADFFSWARAAYPARKYLAVIWNHGSGWTKASASARGISYDDETGSHISVPQLAEVFHLAGPVDVYASDACLMQMAEAAWEMRGHAAYIVGSEETEPADGYPYDRILAALNSAPEMTPGELAGAIVRSYGEYYSGLGIGATMSALRTAALPGLRARTEEFSCAALAAGDKGVLKRGLYYAQHYSYDDNKDLDSFARYVAIKTPDTRLRLAALELSSWIREELVLWRASANYSQTPEGTESIDYSLASGLAVYLPASRPEVAYYELSWAEDSAWGELLRWLHAK